MRGIQLTWLDCCEQATGHISLRAPAWQVSKDHLILDIDSLSPLLVLVSVLLGVLDHAVNLITGQSGCASDLDVLLLACALVCKDKMPKV
jgi:hypothetical protein